MLCCAYCFYDNLHKGHKVVPVKDEESLKKENIDINDYIEDFERTEQVIVNIKDKIENEILTINELYDKMEKETTKSFELKHEKLIKEEKDIKDKLDNEVTKIKSKLEEYLSLLNTIIRNYERLNKGMQILNKEEKNNINMIKKLTYISELNKKQKEMDNISKLLMKSKKLDFIDDNIRYQEYYFNGLPIPKDIQVNDINSNSFCVTWKIDDLNLLNIDKNKIKYKIELRKENEQKFESIYESKNNNHYLNKLESNINYEMRICSAYNDINSEYSDIIKIKTIDSILLNETKKCDECLNKIFEWTGGKRMKLLYRGTRDGMSADKFHDKCDN